MVLRRFAGVTFLLLILLAAVRASAGIATGPLGPGQLNTPQLMAPLPALGLPHAAHHQFPVADEGVTHLFPDLRTIELLPSTAFLLPATARATPGAERDLLSLTHQRRE